MVYGILYIYRITTGGTGYPGNSITTELFFQVFNTLILSLIPVILILIPIIILVRKNKSTNDKISELEKRISNLENK